MAWLHRNPVAAAPLVVALKAQHIDGAVSALSITLTDDEPSRRTAPYTPRFDGQGYPIRRSCIGEWRGPPASRRRPSPETMDAWLRLLSLPATPQDIDVLAPVCEQEIPCRLPQGAQGAMLRQITERTPACRVRCAIALFYGRYGQPTRIEALVERVGMRTAMIDDLFARLENAVG